MIPVSQTSFHSPPDSLGNCFRACVASILEVRIDALPRFEVWMFNNPENWTSIFESWVRHSELDRGVEWLPWPDEEKAIAIGPSPRCSSNHAIIIEDGKVLHDPHPDSSGLTGKPLFCVRLRKV